MNILVTGAGGYVGIPLCGALSKSHNVCGIDRFYFGKKPDCEIEKADIRDIGCGYNILKHKKLPNYSDFYDIDCIIDLAGLSNDASCDIDPELTRSINCEGGIRLAQMAKQAGVKRYLYSSSASVYGDGSGLTELTETSPTNPLTQYARCKKSVEDELLALNGDGFEVVILRNSTIFGVAPRMRFDLAVNIMTARAWRDNLIYIMGGGDQWRPFVHVNDVVDAFMFLMVYGVAGEIYNVGGYNMRIKDLANIVSRYTGAVIHDIPDQPDTRSYNVNFDKINALGWKAGRGVERGITEVVDALESKEISMDDPTCYTLQWYKSLLEWDERISRLKINGRLL